MKLSWRLHSSTLRYLALLLLAIVMLSPAALAVSSFAGLSFTSLSPQELYAIQLNTGYRYGVYVSQVEPGSPAAGQLQPGDIVLAIGATGVDSAEGALATLQRTSGSVQIVALTNRNGSYQAAQFTLNLSQPSNSMGVPPSLPAVAAVVQPMPSASADTQQITTISDLVTAYFDMLDFLRSQAFGKTSVTLTNERQRVGVQLQASWSQIDVQTQMALQQLAQSWLQLKKEWPSMGSTQQETLRKQWRQLLLGPAMVYPPPASPTAYTSGGISFNYPSDWTGGEASSYGVGYMFLGPNGATTWDQVMDAATSPAGGFFTLSQMTYPYQQSTALQTTRQYAQQAGVVGAGMQEIHAAANAQGAIVVMLGRLPGQQEDHFYWIFLAPYQQQLITGRMSGPVSQVETLVPAFWNILSSLQLSASSSSGGGVSAAWDTAWSRVSTGIVKEIWAPSK